MAKKNANNGFIKIDRSILDWEHITEPVVLQVFLYLLLKANHKAKWHNGKMCERGATFVSIRTMCDDLAMSPHTAIKALRTLEESGEVVRRQVTQKLSKTKLLNYSKYQGNNVFSVAQTATQSATQTATQSATKQERKERKELVVDVNKKAHAHEELIKDLFSREITMESFAKNEGITLDQCRRYAEATVIEWQLTDENHNNRTQAIKHLLSQIRIKAQADRERGITFTDKSVRLQPIIDFCRELIADGFNRQDVKDWYGYWTEECQDRTGRMRFEAEKTWNAKRRFNNYLKRKAQ